MKALRIDGRHVDVPDGTTVLQAACDMGIEIPALCYLRGCKPQTSCMVCAVKDTLSGRLIPSCAATVADGMDIDTKSDGVTRSRRRALELLLSEHVGDCEGPCRLGCPAHMNIPEMIRLIAADRFREALDAVRESIALPAVLSRVCNAPCEKVCRRNRVDKSVSICLLKRACSDPDRNDVDDNMAPCANDTGKHVAVVGAGPTGLAAAYYLRRAGHACTVFTRSAALGGTLRTDVSQTQLPTSVLDADVDHILATGVTVRAGVTVGHDEHLPALMNKFNAVLLATGAPSDDDGNWPQITRGNGGLIQSSPTFETNMPGLFAAGAAVHATRTAIRAVADGRNAALSIDGFLQTGTAKKATRPFGSRMARMTDAEVALFSADASGRSRVVPVGAEDSGFTRDEAVREAERCLDCDCLKSNTCSLRKCADIAGVKQKYHALAERPEFEAIMRGTMVVYEPGKCIRCGICIDLTEGSEGSAGLAFTGRGFNVRVRPPVDSSIEDALGDLADRCVRACPTAALSFIRK